MIVYLVVIINHFERVQNEQTSKIFQANQGRNDFRTLPCSIGIADRFRLLYLNGVLES